MSYNFSSTKLYELTGSIIFCYLKTPSLKYGKNYLIKILIDKNSEEHKKLNSIDEDFKKDLLNSDNGLSQEDLKEINSKYFLDGAESNYESSKNGITISLNKKADFKIENLNKRPPLKIKQDIVDENGDSTGKFEFVDADPDIFESGAKVAVKFSLNYHSKSNNIYGNLVAVLYKDKGTPIIQKKYLTGILSFPYLDQPSTAYGVKYSCEVLVDKNSPEHKQILEETKAYKDKLIKDKVTKKASVYCIVDGDKEDIDLDSYTGKVALRASKRADHEKEEYQHLNEPPKYYKQIEARDSEGNLTGKHELVECDGSVFQGGNIVKIAYRLWYAPPNNSINANLDEVIFLETGKTFLPTHNDCSEKELEEWS